MALNSDAQMLQLQYQQLEESAQKTMRELSALLNEVSGPQAGTGEQTFGRGLRDYLGWFWEFLMFLGIWDACGNHYISKV